MEIQISTSAGKRPKILYSGESENKFAQKLIDSLLFGRPNGPLQLTAEHVDTNSYKKKIPTVMFYVGQRNRPKERSLVGEWSKNGKAWHYDELPKKLQKAAKDAL